MTIDQRLQKTHTRVYTDNDNAIQTRGDHENVKHEKNSKTSHHRTDNKRLTSSERFQ